MTMNKLLQTPPLKLLGQASVGKIRQHKQEPLVPIMWSKQTRLDIHIHYQFGQLELVLTKWDRMRYWGLEQEPLTIKLNDHAHRIVDTIQASWLSNDIRDETQMQEYIVSSKLNTLYPRAVQYVTSTTPTLTHQSSTNIQLHHHHVALLGQILATCDCISAALQKPTRLTLAHLLAYLYQCLNIQRHPQFLGYRIRIEQRFEDFKTSSETVILPDECDWITMLMNDIQSRILCQTAADEHNLLGACSDLFEVMKRSTAPLVLSAPIPEPHMSLPKSSSSSENDT